MGEYIADLHCDLLYYLLQPDSDINNDELGCSIPYLQQGKVKLQVMAIFAPTQINSHALGIRQSEIFYDLNVNEDRLNVITKNDFKSLGKNEGIGMIASIESASAFCDEKISLDEGFKNLERIISNVGEIFYVSLTHHPENRFGGGNYSTVGLKNDGKALLDYLDNKNIAVDFSHTSDQLAYDILNYLSKQRLNVSIIASHSNYRPIFDHPRNLPNDIAQEIVHQKGLIGVNFLRAFMDDENPNALYNHIDHGIKLGAENAICYGADFFYTQNHPDQTRIPFYFKQHDNASKYKSISAEVKRKFGENISDKIAFQNVLNFLNR